jgi:hypothetical protein
MPTHASKATPIVLRDSPKEPKSFDTTLRYSGRIIVKGVSKQMAEVQPQKKINDDAQKLKSALTLPDPPANRCKWEQAKAYFDLLTPDQWEQVQTYIYRTKPIITKPRPFYIDLISGRLDYDNILALHGGGEYRLDVQDHGRSKKIMEVTLSIPMSIAPKLDLAELDFNEPKNRGFITQQIAEGKITRDGTPVQPNTPPPGNLTVPEAMMKQSQEFMQLFMRMNETQRQQLIEASKNKDELGGTVGQILIEKMKQDNPNGMMPMFLEFMKTQKNSTSEITPLVALITGMMNQMVTMQSENTKVLIEVMKTNKEKPESEEGKGPFDNLKELLELAKMVKGGGSVEKSTLETIVDGISTVAPPLLQTIGQYLNFASVSRQGVMGTPMPAPGDIMQPPGNMPQPTAQLPPPNVIQMPQPKQELQQMSPIQSVAQTFAAQGKLIYTHMENSGALFAQDIINLYGKPIWQMITKFDDATILAGAKTVPEFWNQVLAVYSEEYFVKWIADFRDYEKVLAEMEEEEGEEQ